MTLEFAGAALPLSDANIFAVAQQLGVEPALIAAVAEVESAGDGFLPDKRPKILFEAHIFARETGQRYNRSHPGISAPSWDRSLYGASGARQYERLHEAIALDRTAALRSASWGRFQIMGFNHALCGFPTVEAFVARMRDGEAEHLAAFVAFCQARDLIRYLAVHDWAAFTKGYNGPGQVAHYSELLAAAYRRHAAKTPHPPLPVGEGGSSPRRTPQERIEALQVVLAADGRYLGPIDGDFGKRSRAALNELLAAAGQPRL